MHDGNKPRGGLVPVFGYRLWQRDERAFEEVKAPKAKLNLSSR